MHLLTGISLALLWGLVGSVLRHKTKLSSVAISALLTLLAALVLPRLFVNGHLFALICTAVSYVTMSSTERLAKVWETLTVSVFCALAVYFGQNLLVRIGGRLGTFAALSVLFFTIPKAHKHLIFGRR